MWASSELGMTSGNPRQLCYALGMTMRVGDRKRLQPRAWCEVSRVQPAHCAIFLPLSPISTGCTPGEARS